MDISYLSEFLTVAEELNFSRAAKTLNVSQPALSNHIIALEEELGVRLFERTKRRVSLTHEGKLLLADAQRILDTFEEMHRFNKRDLMENRVLTVGGFLDNPSVLGLLTCYVKDFSSAQGLNLKLMCDYDLSVSHQEKLEAKTLDLFVGYSNSLDLAACPSIASIPFCQDPFYVVLHKDNPLASQRSVTMKDLKDLALVKLAGPQYASGLEQVIDACARNGFSPKLHSTFVNTLTDCTLMEIGVNKCFIFAYGGFAGGFAFNARHDLAILPVEGESFTVDLFYNQEDVPPLLEHFLEYVSHRELTGKA